MTLSTPPDNTPNGPNNAVPNNDSLIKGTLATLPFAVYNCDPAGNIVWYNDECARLWGRWPQIGAEKWSGAYKLTDTDGNAVALEESPAAVAVSSGKHVDRELVVKRPDGTSSQVLVHARPIMVDGKVVGVAGTLTDITYEKQAERKEAMLAAIIESSEDAIISKTLNGMITSWNKAAERLFGYEEHEVLGKHISLLIPEERLAEEDHIINKIRNSQKVDHFETIRVTKSGEQVSLSLTVSPIHDRKGKIIGGSKIARDIGKQKAAEDRLQRYAESLEVLNSMSELISAELDIESILQKVTDATTQLTGAQFGAFFHNLVNEDGESYTLFTLSGAPREAFEKFGMPRNTHVFAPTFKGEGVVRVDDITKDPRYGHNHPHYGMPKGHLPVVSYLAVPVMSKSGEVVGGLFFGHPKPGMFTEEHEQLISAVAAQAAVALDNAKLYEEIKLLNAKKDEFIGMASHELKTPITSLQGFLQIMERNTSDGDRNKYFIGKALTQIGKLNTLISDLLDVSKIQAGKLPFNFANFDLITLTKEVIEMMQHSYNTHHIRFEHGTQPLIVKADQQRLEQVIINLISNAVKYSPNSNEVLVSLKAIKNKAHLSVRDFGIGIEKSKQNRIFSRFYRVENLAAHFSGLGIGLYISQEIISRHKGKIWVDSEPGQGSTFNIEIPLEQ